MGWARWESSLHAYINPSITIWSLLLYTPSHTIPKIKIEYGPVDGCFLPASLSVTGIMAVMKSTIRTTYEWDWRLARILKTHACIVDVQKEVIKFGMVPHTLCISITASGSSSPLYYSFTKAKNSNILRYLGPFLLAEKYGLKLLRRAPKHRGNRSMSRNAFPPQIKNESADNRRLPLLLAMVPRISCIKS